jgi:hypothetical protein
VGSLLLFLTHLQPLNISLLLEAVVAAAFEVVAVAAVDSEQTQVFR